MFDGLNVFPLTPLADDRVDEKALIRLVQRCEEARVDSITVLGSTGCGVYLTRQERADVVRLAVGNVERTPVLAGISALRTSQVQRLAADAQDAGAAGVLLAPVSYQGLADSEVLGLYEKVTADLSVPLVVYDNPQVTHFSFTDELYRTIARLPHVVSIKIPGPSVSADIRQARALVEHLEAILPDRVGIGVSGDPYAVTGLRAGCDTWYSVIGGILPDLALAITRAVQKGDDRLAESLSSGCRPLWRLFAAYGSLRVTALVAEHLGLVSESCLPSPLQRLGDGVRAEVARALEALAVLS